MVAYILQIAQLCSKHDTIGQDLVAMCVNDILAQGAEPLFFLDYFSCGKLDLSTTEAVIAGIAGACRQAGCALLGMDPLTHGPSAACWSCRTKMISLVAGEGDFT